MTIAELFYAKQAHRARSFIPLRRPSQRRKHPPRHRKFLLEPLEPRVLLSAEPTLLHVEMLALGPNLTIRLDGTTQLLQVVETPTGAVVAERPRDGTRAGRTKGIQLRVLPITVGQWVKDIIQYHPFQTKFIRPANASPTDFARSRTISDARRHAGNHSSRAFAPALRLRSWHAVEITYDLLFIQPDDQSAGRLDGHWAIHPLRSA